MSPSVVKSELNRNQKRARFLRAWTSPLPCGRKLVRPFGKLEAVASVGSFLPAENPSSCACGPAEGT
jgi:hypothetical protein